MTVAVVQIGGQLVASLPVEACFPGDFYDADLKMSMDSRGPGKFSYARPDMGFGLEADIRAAALRVHTLIGCHGFSRVDFILSASGAWSILEVNTIPGLTRAGNYVACLRSIGLTYDQIVLAMLQSCALTRVNMNLSMESGD